MNAESSAFAREPDGPGREALNVLYRFVAALDLTPTVAVHSIDRDGLVRYWNRTCTTIFGVSAADALGRPLTSLASHMDREEEFASTLNSIWESGRAPPPRDWHIRRLDGDERWLYSTHFPVIYNNAPEQVFCMEIDISRRKVDEAALVAAGASFRQLFERSHDAMLLIEGNLIADANPAALAMFGAADREALAGKSLLDFSPPRQDGGEPSVLLDAARTAQAFVEGNQCYEWQFHLPDGRDFWAEVLLTSVSLDHEFRSYAVLRDISLRKQTERSLIMAAQVFDNSRDAILITDARFRMLAVNQAYTAMTGLRPDQVLGLPAPGMGIDEHDTAFYEQIRQLAARHEHWEGEWRGVRAEGEAFPIWAAVTAIRATSGEVANFMAILSDITDRKQVEERTRHLAEHDFLTDLPNRMLFLDRLHQALAAARRKHSKVAVLFVDLDRFKGINDSFGHHVGDDVLREVARRLTGCVRSVDTVSRQGGDEFVVILAEIGGVDQAAHVAGSVMQAVARPVQSDGHSISLSVSIGIAIYPGDGDDVDSLLKHADVAMYHAKQNGRNAFRFFSPEMNAHVIERVQMENNLRQALANNEFVLEYLPAISIASGEITGVEALIRWRHPQRGLLLPNEFLPVAEDSGLIVPIGDWVLRQACLQGRAWRDQGFGAVVSVNLTSMQFFHDDLLGSVEAALRQSGLAPGLLELEITEDIIMAGDEKAIATVQALRGLGVQLTIDDFGTGSSSLSILRRFPLSKLKIDRSFVDDIMRKPADAAIIPAIIAVARSLRLRVIAEGVETVEQLQFLRQHGCDDYQGYYANPASSDPDLRPRTL